MLNKKILISHSSKNKKIGDSFFNCLINLGVDLNNIFYSSKNSYGIPLNNNINSYMKKQLQETDVVIVLLSNEYLNSAYCLNEIGACWSLNKTLIPIIIDDISANTSIDFVFSSIMKIDFSKGIEDSQYILSNLSKELGIEYSQENLFIIDNFRLQTKKYNESFKITKTQNMRDITRHEQRKLEKLFSKRNKSLFTTNNLSEFLNKVFSSNEFFTALIDSCHNSFSYNLVSIKISSLLNYYLLTRDLSASYIMFYKIMNNVNEIKTFIDKELIFDGIKKCNPNSKEDDYANILLNNFFLQGYVCHSCNPVYIENILLNGFSKKDNSLMSKNLEDLEELVYKNKFLTRQENSVFYYTLPSANAVHYAIALSPERVFGGPLKILGMHTLNSEDISVNEIVPVRVGENIQHYYKRIAHNNIKIVTKNNSFERSIRNILKRKMNKLVKDFCYNYSYMLLLSTENGLISAFNTSVEINNKNQTLNSYISKYACGIGLNILDIKTFDEMYSAIQSLTPKGIGIEDNTLMGNISSANNVQDMSKTLVIKIPSFYKIMQFYLKRHYVIGKKVKIKINPYIKD